MWIEIAAGAYLLGEFIYHQLDRPQLKQGVRLKYPRGDEGASVPLIYGRVRVGNPVLALADEVSSINDNHLLDMLFVLGIPMNDGFEATSRVHGMWIGKNKVPWVDGVAGGQTGSGGPETPMIQLGLSSALGAAEFLNGNPSQVIAGDLSTEFTAPTNMGRRLMHRGYAVGRIPGYRNMMSVFLTASEANLYTSTIGFLVYTPNSEIPQGWSFECSSYHSTGGWPAAGIYAQIGQDSNPINVLYDLLIGKFGKLEVDPANVDLVTFGAAATTLYFEGNGYSRCIDERKSVEEWFDEILGQIDAAFFYDPLDDKFKIKLIRPDYDPPTIPHIHKDNCDEIQNFEMSGRTNPPNVIHVVYTDRSKGYQRSTATAIDQAALVEQGYTDERTIQMPGVTYDGLAQAIAGRELAAQALPLMKLRALVDRSFLRVNPGDAIKVTWTNPDIAGIVFRVANVDRGTLENGKIALDLVQDVFYQWRNDPPTGGEFGVVGDPPTTVLGP
jgi:hypothetical protein